MSYVKYFLIVLGLFFLASCVNKKDSRKIETLKRIVDKSLGKKLILPDSLQMFKLKTTSINDSVSIFNSEYKIYSELNVSCGACLMKIDLWDKLISELSQYEIPIILICRSDDNFELIKHLDMSEQIPKFSYPLFFDNYGRLYG